MNNLLKKYNKPETLLVITSFPNPENGKYGVRDFNAIGEHSERRLPYIASKRPVLVLAEDLGTTKYFEPQKNIAVCRVWKKGNLFSILNLARIIKNLTEVKSILVQFEFNVMGGIKANLMLLLALAFLKINGKKITFEMHQVLTDIGAVKRHINIENPIMQRVYNLGLKIFYATTGLISDKIIVFEEEMADRLKRFVKASKIEVLCLSVDQQKVISKNKARAKLHLPKDEFVLLVFGFINGYKGIEWIMESLKNAGNKNIRLIIAGGKNPYLINKPYYQKFYNSIVAEAKKHKHVTYTDFVPDDKVYLYYSAADIAVMPYTAFMSASGPFSRALAHQKAVIISEKLVNYAKSKDFITCLALSGLKKEDIVFKLSKKTFIKRLEKVRTDSEYLNKLNVFSKNLAYFRNIKNVTAKLDTIVFAPQKSAIAVRSVAENKSIRLATSA
jgi:glycosyltransferase involved in cell wall biosynthesis